MGKFIDLKGQRFGKLVVLERAPNGNCGQVRWLCKCDCGNYHTASTATLRTKRVTSCGCYNSECHTTHGDSRKSALYKAWDGMRYRCKSDSPKNFNVYKSRGIKVCDEWANSYESFRDWAMANGYRKGLSLDRIDNDGNYEPSNCRWITMREQQRNKRCTHYITYNGTVKPLSEWAGIYGLSQNRLRARIYAGWTNPQEILFGK